MVAGITRQGVIILGLLLIAVLYVILFILPDISQTEITGFRGQQIDEYFLVSHVWKGSPAEHAGLRPDDRILSAAGRSMTDWFGLFGSDESAYLRHRASMRDTAVQYHLLRDSRPIDTTLQARTPSLAEIGIHYGIKLALLVYLAGLAVFISLSSTRQRGTFLVSLSLCLAIPWLASLEPYSHLFFSPFLRGIMPLTYTIKMVEAFSLLLFMSTLVHITLVFPERHPVLTKREQILVSLYLFPPALLGLVMLVSSGDLLNRLESVYLLRLWLTTILLVLATLLILYSYRHCESPLQRERTRWIVVSLVIVSVSHLVLWNLPLMLRGQALIANYDWLLVPMALIPLALTVSITNHELFGIRGIIRGRIRLLETRLDRERQMVVSQDQKIRDLSQEIEHLKSDLQEFTLSEQIAGPGQATAPALARLEQRYPELADIRRERLVSASPHWDQVFEQTVLAAQEITPVIIVGESGTGKTDLAWTVHRLGKRRDEVYKAVSCAQFEHADPAFALGRLFGIGTGHGLPHVPREGQPGLLEQCDGGTLFLDDVDRLPLNAQDLLLYPLEGKAFEPGIGSGSTRMVSIKFVFATNRDPDRLVAEGLFRADVLSRIGTRIDIPPLRERPEDIPPLIDLFVGEISAEFKHEITVISPRAMNLLCSRSWASGNARELRLEISKAIGRAMLEDDSVLRAGYLSELAGLQAPAEWKDGKHDLASTQSPGSDRADEPSISPELAVLRRSRFQIKPAEKELGLSHKSRTLSNHLRGICIEALSENDWDLQLAARKLSGTDDPTINTKIAGKMRRYLDNIRQNLRSGSEQRLYNNLPAHYHTALQKAIDWLRDRQAGGLR